MELCDPGLLELGWRPFFAAQTTEEEQRLYDPVRVMAVHRGNIVVAGSGAGMTIPASLADTAEDRPTVGDWLLVDREVSTPIRILDRTNLFKRLAPGGGRRMQLIAANVDTLFIVASCNQDFNIARLERYLVLAREVGVNPIVVLTKIDLTDRHKAFVAAARDLQPGLVVEAVDARDAGSMGALAAWCGAGQTVALLGSSGVGKSTLVNSLRGSDHLATQAVRAADGKGRHTTTVREMHRLDLGGWLLDTPGMRELQLAEAASGLAAVFDDIVVLAGRCRFSNCGHDVEPNCAVRDAVENGMLVPARLARWRRLVAEDALNSRDGAGRPTGSKQRDRRK